MCLPEISLFSKRVVVFSPDLNWYFLFYKCFLLWVYSITSICFFKWRHMYSSNKVYRLHMFLYDLKHEPHSWFRIFQNVIQQFGILQSEIDHSRFHHHSLQGCIFLIVNWNDILIKGSVQRAYFPSKTIVWSIVPEERQTIVLTSKVAESKVGLIISQRKYALDIWEETGMLKAKLVHTSVINIG